MKKIVSGVFYMKMDFTDDGATDIATLRDDTCDGNPRAGGCSVDADEGPEPSWRRRRHATRVIGLNRNGGAAPECT